MKTALQPHSQFHTDETRIDRDAPPGGSLEIALPVRFGERPGDVVENPFLILRISDGRSEWHMLVRVRVGAGERGEPRAMSSPSCSINRVSGAENRRE